MLELQAALAAFAVVYVCLYAEIFGGTRNSVTGFLTDLYVLRGSRVAGFLRDLIACPFCFGFYPAALFGGAQAYRSLEWDGVGTVFDAFLIVAATVALLWIIVCVYVIVDAVEQISRAAKGE